ncbi:hypothetical protein SODALDRAFT_330189 [Sodiomyces alkalinus F11]|uniref:Uncharacterized protein n=1 Tax=Sodiomyces alkalinus (strain CBS 110278 / VKM F-3762 / F11) TaxID=1314773 RepID=A0A3N2Q140_SODAK|nr:hypothetical protein SODALDRAFT_330189 [Sodiomyces alkalinus F11]ROT40471.1 hypothetical protein SODALDRAFT_330189 [Sodiomyces alkalinus F11]
MPATYLLLIISPKFKMLPPTLAAPSTPARHEHRDPFRGHLGRQWRPLIDNGGWRGAFYLVRRRLWSAASTNSRRDLHVVFCRGCVTQKRWRQTRASQ